jgi:hypothetical protein
MSDEEDESDTWLLSQMLAVKIDLKLPNKRNINIMHLSFARKKVCTLQRFQDEAEQNVLWISS